MKDVIISPVNAGSNFVIPVAGIIRFILVPLSKIIMIIL